MHTFNKGVGGDDKLLARPRREERAIVVVAMSIGIEIGTKASSELVPVRACERDVDRS